MIDGLITGAFVVVVWLAFAARERRRHMRDAAQTLEHYRRNSRT